MRTPGDISKSMMTLEELRAAAPPGTDIEAFLDALGVPHGGGLVPRLLVEQALGLRASGPSAAAPHSAVVVARKTFDRAGIDVASATRTRGWTIVLVAREQRRIYNELHEDDPVAWPAIDLAPGAAYEAKLYFASKRHLSAAHFLVSGLDRAPDDRLFVFVLVPGERVWLATARELRMLQRAQDDDVGDSKTKMKKKFGRVGASASKPGRSVVKVWFPVGNTSFDAEEQIRDERGRQVLPIESRGGRAR